MNKLEYTKNYKIFPKGKFACESCLKKEHTYIHINCQTFDDFCKNKGLFARVLCTNCYNELEG